MHMETVFDSAIKALGLDETHNLLAATMMGRIALYQVTKDKGGKQSHSTRLSSSPVIL